MSHPNKVESEGLNRRRHANRRLHLLTTNDHVALPPNVPACHRHQLSPGNSSDVKDRIAPSPEFQLPILRYYVPSPLFHVVPGASKFDSPGRTQTACAGRPQHDICLLANTHIHGMALWRHLHRKILIFVLSDSKPCPRPDVARNLHKPFHQHCLAYSNPPTAYNKLSAR